MINWISLGSLASLAPQVARLINADQSEGIALLLNSYSVPQSEHAEVTRQLAIGFSLGEAFGRCGQTMPACSLAQNINDPEAVERIARQLIPSEEEGAEPKRLSIWPTNPFAGIFFAASGVAALISAAFFATGHPFLGVWGAAGTTAGVLWSLNLNGNFRR